MQGWNCELMLLKMLSYGRVIKFCYTQKDILVIKSYYFDCFDTGTLNQMSDLEIICSYPCDVTFCNYYIIIHPLYVLCL
jgi:hypothetical protein